MSGAHSHSHSGEKDLGLSFLINTSFVVMEFTAGLFSNSLTLISDSVHNLTDSLSILLAYIASRIGRRQANHQKTFGYGRTAILAATINAVILLLTSLFIFHEAYQRFLHPEPVNGGVVAIIAVMGIVSNGAIALVVRRGRGINSRAIFVGNLMDTLSSAGALIAGIVIVVTKQSWADPLISLLIGVLLLYAAWEILQEALNIFLESVPKGIDALEVKKSILAIDHIGDLDDLHIWTMGAGESALMCHIIVDDCAVSESVKIVSAVKHMLVEKYAITHATIETQIECGPHDNERTDEGLSMAQV